MVVFFCLFFAFASFLDGSCFEGVWLSVVDVDWSDARFDEVAGAEEEAGEVAGDVAVGVFEWCAVSLADDGEELVEDVVGVDGDDASAEVLEADLCFWEEVAEVYAHGVWKMCVWYFSVLRLCVCWWWVL